MIKNKEKQFDCIKMKNSIQMQVNAETRNMSKEELLDYFNNNSQGCLPSFLLENGQLEPTSFSVFSLG